MKLRHKLILSFCCIILLPLTLSVLLGAGIYLNHREAFRLRYGVTLELSDLISGDSGISDRIALSLNSELEEKEQSESDFWEDDEALRDFAEQKTIETFQVLVWRDGELISDSADLTEEMLDRADAVLPDASGGCTAVHTSGDVWWVYDVYTAETDSGKVTFLGLVDSSRRFPLGKTIMRQFGISIVFILLLTAGLCTVWIYRPTMMEIGVLEDAAKRISEGDLDFHIHAGGKDEMSELCRAFEKARERLKQTQEEKLQADAANRELIRNISHDLRTPITAIQGYVEGIRDGVASTPEMMDRYLGVILSRTKEMSRLIDELSFYTRMNSEGIPYNFRVLPAADFIRDCAEEFESQLAADGAEFTCESEVQPGTKIAVDSEQMHRVFSNIIGNSLKYADKTPCRIRLQATETKDTVKLVFSDNGRGIAEQDLEHIFERFYRADAARTSTGGSGIGLSIVKKIVEDHGGTVSAESTVGQGTSMIIELQKYTGKNTGGTK
ncbi:MAG: sensor histidine kinase [Lachnospiraceae bacterium]